MELLTFESIQTLVRKAFDPETISVAVGKLAEESMRVRVVVRDEVSKGMYGFHISLGAPVERLHALIREAATVLNLVEGPDKIGNEVVNAPAQEGDGI